MRAILVLWPRAYQVALSIARAPAGKQAAEVDYVSLGEIVQIDIVTFRRADAVAVAQIDTD
jgi:hypothetical protein